MRMATITDRKDEAMTSLPGIHLNESIRNRAADLAANATPKRRELVQAWIDISVAFDLKGQHVYANKAAFNAGGIASGMTPMKNCPVTLADNWA